MSSKKRGTFRFASGSLADPFSQIWRVSANGDDVYLTESKLRGGKIKISLHKSQWNYAWTTESGVARNDRLNPRGGPDRRVCGIRRPAPFARGLTAGPSIYVPLTSVGSRRLLPQDIDGKAVSWWHPPTSERMVRFALLFVDPEAGQAIASDGEEVLGGISLLDGRRVLVTARWCRCPAAYLARVEEVIRANQCPVETPADWAGGSLIFKDTVENLNKDGVSEKAWEISDIPAQAVIRGSGTPFVRASGEPHVARGSGLHLTLKVSQ